MRKLSKPGRLQQVAGRVRDESLPVEQRSTHALGRHFGVSHRTICNDLEELGIPPVGKPAAGGSKEARQAIVLELYATHSCAEIAVEVRERTGQPCSVGPIKRDVHELAARGLLAVRKPAPRRKYPEPKPRPCECGQCGGELFTPTATQVRDGFGRFKDWDHYAAWKRAQVLEVAAEAVALWNAGNTLDEIVEAKPELARHRVWRSLRLAPAHGVQVMPRRRGKQPGRYRERGQLVKCKARGRDYCPHGDTERWIYASHLAEHGEFLSAACWARYRWEYGLGNLREFVRAAAALGGSWRRDTRRHWLGKWDGKLPPAPGKRARGRPAGPPLTAEQCAKVLQLRGQDWGIRSIAKHLGVNWRRVEELIASTTAPAQ